MAFRLTFLILAAILSLAGIARPASAAEPAKTEDLTEATQALLIDLDADAVLYAKSADAAFAPASLAKLMTLVVTFDEIKAGRLSQDDLVTVSEYAWRTGGAPSRTPAMFAAVRSRIAVRDLIRGAIIPAGNDAALLLAEKIAGSPTAFTEMMNAKARQFGMTRSTFVNPTGLPEAGQRVTARDLATLARRLIEDYPEFLPIFAEPEFTWNRIRQLNRNPLIGAVDGATGLAAGYTQDFGYNLVGTVDRKGRRLLVVMAGIKSDKARIDDARKLIEYGYDAFEERQLFAAGDEVASVKVFGGDSGSVPLLSARVVSLLTPKGDVSPVRARVVYRGPLRAPVAKGTVAGTLKVWRGQTLTLEVPLHTGIAVETGGLPSRALDGAAELMRQGVEIVWTRITTRS